MQKRTEAKLDHLDGPMTKRTRVDGSPPIHIRVLPFANSDEEPDAKPSPKQLSAPLQSGPLATLASIAHPSSGPGSSVGSPLTFKMDPVLLLTTKTKPTEQEMKLLQEEVDRGAEEAQAKKRANVALTLDKMHFDTAKDQLVDLIETARTLKKPGQVIVVNDSRLFQVPKDRGNVYLGHVVYTGAQSRIPHSNRAADLRLYLLPPFSQKHHYALIEVRVPAEFLTYRGNVSVRKSALWGTDVYTDDSDVVGVIIHSGHYRPVDAPDIPVKESAPDMAGIWSAFESEKTVSEGFLSLNVMDQFGTVKSPISGPVDPLVAEPDASKSSNTILLPDHDLHVTLRVLPKLIKYAGTTRNGLDSRGWGASHDGESIAVVKVEKVERASVFRKGRKAFAKQWGELAHNVTKPDEFGGSPRRRVHSGGLVGSPNRRSPPRPYSKNIPVPHLIEDEPPEITIVFSQINGAACIKYSARVMKDWPLHFSAIVSGTKGVSEHDVDDSVLDYTKQELVDMASYPFWRVKLARFRCILEMSDDSRYELSKSDVKDTFVLYNLIGDKRTIVYNGVKPSHISWGHGGLELGGDLLQPGTARILWEKY